MGGRGGAGGGGGGVKDNYFIMNPRKLKLNLSKTCSETRISASVVLGSIKKYFSVLEAMFRVQENHHKPLEFRRTIIHLYSSGEPSYTFRVQGNHHTPLEFRRTIIHL